MRNKHNRVVSDHINSGFNSNKQGGEGESCVRHQSRSIHPGAWVSAALCWAQQSPASSPDLTWRVQVCRKTNSFMSVCSDTASRQEHFRHALWVELCFLMTVSVASAFFTSQFFSCVYFKWGQFSLSHLLSSSWYNKTVKIYVVETESS